MPMDQAESLDKGLRDAVDIGRGWRTCQHDGPMSLGCHHIINLIIDRIIDGVSSR